MKQHIENFPQYILEWYEIGNKIDLSHLADYETLVLVWMWGSAMALTVMKWLVEASKKSLPVHVVTHYNVPNWVNEKTLMICASYSGNTEETVSAMNDALGKGAQMMALTSGGLLADFCIQWWHTYAQMPTGIEPRAALPYSFGIQLALFEQLGHIDGIKNDLDRFSERSSTHEAKVHLQAKNISEHMHDRFPFVYATPWYEAVALRTQQQIQENSRMLAHHHILPEHNHNELLGRQEWNAIVDVLWLIDPDAYNRNQKRVELTKALLDERAVPQFDILLQWPTTLTKIISWIYQVDRLSFYLAEQRWIDPSGMKIIEDLKGEMKKFV